VGRKTLTQLINQKMRQDRSRGMSIRKRSLVVQMSDDCKFVK